MSENKSGFDPSQHLIKLKGKDYLEAKWRLVWLRSEHPDAQVETAPVRIDEGLAIIRAKVTLPSGACGAGIGSESPTDFADYIEKAETKALSRALATLGYGTQFCDDFDTPVTADGRLRIADAPVERKTTTPQVVALSAMSEIEEEHYAALIAAPSMAALNNVAETIADGGISHPALREAYRRRRGELQAPVEPGQPLLNISRRVLVEAAGV